MTTVKLGEILEVKKGKKPEVLSATPKQGFLPYVDIKAFEQGVIEAYADGTACLSCNTGDLLLVCDGSRSGLIGHAMKGYVGSTLAKISANGLQSNYLAYFLQSKYRMLNTKVKGTGTPHVNLELLKSFTIPLPPLPEQERIVARIEELLSELDKGVEALQTIKAQLRVYRQAVLKEAFEGVLTKEWRHFNIAAGQAERDFLACKLINPNYNDTSCDESALSLSIPLEWKSLRLGDVFTVEVGATPSRKISDYWNGDICWVSSGEVKFSEIYSTKECITQEGLKHASTNVHPKGTVLLAMIGEGKTRGQAAILRTKAAHNQNTAAILVSKTPCAPEYIYYFLMLTYDYTRRVGSGNNQKALNKERVRAIKFPFAPFSEQITVVAEIESRLSVCDQIEKTVDESLAKAESLRQSILKKTFEGRL